MPEDPRGLVGRLRRRPILGMALATGVQLRGRAETTRLAVPSAAAPARRG